MMEGGMAGLSVCAEGGEADRRVSEGKKGAVGDGEGGSVAAAAAAVGVLQQAAPRDTFPYAAPCTEHPDGGMGELLGGRSKRVPGGQVLKNPRFQEFLQQLRSSSTSIGQAEGRVLRLKQYVGADARPQVIDAVLDALEKNHVVEALYIQNFEKGMFDAQLEHLQKVLRNRHIWALNVGENFQISLEAWRKFTAELPNTAVAYLYVSEHHLLRTDLKVKMRDAIRENRKAAPSRDPQVITLIGNMWYNPKLPPGYDAAAATWQKKELQRHGHLLRARVPASRKLIEAEAEGLRKRPLPPSLHGSQAKRARHNLAGSSTATAYSPLARAPPKKRSRPSIHASTSPASAKDKRLERSHRLARRRSGGIRGPSLHTRSRSPLSTKPTRSRESGGRSVNEIANSRGPGRPPSAKGEFLALPLWEGKRPRSQRAQRIAVRGSDGGHSEIQNEERTSTAPENGHAQDAAHTNAPCILGPAWLPASQSEAAA